MLTIFCLSVVFVIIIMYNKGTKVAELEKQKAWLEAQRQQQASQEATQKVVQQAHQDVLDSLFVPEEEDELLVQYAFITAQGKAGYFDSETVSMAIAKLNKALIFKGATLDGIQSVQQWALAVSSKILTLGLDREAAYVLLLREANEFLSREFPIEE
ncbi:hypothetical protein [Aeromonas veronii]|uniref:hypothetical protein n=1 Tax=Aeromonas veronii TaxID=654 RepID=UPI003BA0100A